MTGKAMEIHWSKSVGSYLSLFTCRCFSAALFIKQQAAHLDGGVLKNDCSTTTPSGAAVFPVFMRGKVHFSTVAHLPTHVAEVWNADLETRKHLGIMLTDPLNRFPQSLLSHKEQCHVAKFKSMRSAFCLLFLACQKVLL